MLDAETCEEPDDPPCDWLPVDDDPAFGDTTVPDDEDDPPEPDDAEDDPPEPDDTDADDPAPDEADEDDPPDVEEADPPATEMVADAAFDREDMGAPIATVAKSVSVAK